MDDEQIERLPDEREHDKDSLATLKRTIIEEDAPRVADQAGDQGADETWPPIEVGQQKVDSDDIHIQQVLRGKIDIFWEELISNPIEQLIIEKVTTYVRMPERDEQQYDSSNKNENFQDFSIWTTCFKDV